MGSKCADNVTIMSPSMGDVLLNLCALYHVTDFFSLPVFVLFIYFSEKRKRHWYEMKVCV